MIELIKKITQLVCYIGSGMGSSLSTFLVSFLASYNNPDDWLTMTIMTKGPLEFLPYDKAKQFGKSIQLLVNKAEEKNMNNLNNNEIMIHLMQEFDVIMNRFSISADKAISDTEDLQKQLEELIIKGEANNE